MGKYIFNRNYGNFKKGDVVDAELIINSKQSEQNYYLVNGVISIRFGKNNAPPIEPLPNVVASKQLLKDVNPEEYTRRLEEDKKNTAMLKTKGRLLLGAYLITPPLALYAFCKYQKYDAKKTLKVTAIGSVVVFALIVANGFSGWSNGKTFLDRNIGNSKYW